MSPSHRPPPSSSTRLMLLSEAPEAQYLAAHLGQVYGPVSVVGNLSQSLQLLQQNTYDLILLEEAIAAAGQGEWEAWQETCGATLVLELNLALTNPERLLRQVKLALIRQQRYSEVASKAAAHTLRDELSVSVAGILLQSQLLLKEADCEPRPALEQIAGLAETLSRALRVD